MKPAGKITRLTDRTATKGEIIRHLEAEHLQAVTKPLQKHRWTKAALTDLHRLIHLGLGR